MIPHFENKEALLEFFGKDLKGDKARFYAMKKASFKKADAVHYRYEAPTKEDALKDIGVTQDNVSTGGALVVKAVINTTNIMDSHDDVHIPGLWKKSLSEIKIIYHIQEHEMCFENVISDNVNGYTKTITWKNLGENYDGNTQALMFDSTITPDRNPFMYEQYQKGYVRNHSVGMQYVKIIFCYNSKDKMWAEEKANWDSYIGQVVNSKQAEEKGYFWAVLEAKLVEGSAVLIGSNQVTPTLTISESKAIVEAADNGTSSQIESLQNTQQQPSQMGMMKQILSTVKNEKNAEIKNG